MWVTHCGDSRIFSFPLKNVAPAATMAAVSISRQLTWLDTPHCLFYMFPPCTPGALPWRQQSRVIQIFRWSIYIDFKAARLWILLFYLFPLLSNCFSSPEPCPLPPGATRTAAFCLSLSTPICPGTLICLNTWALTSNLERVYSGKISHQHKSYPVQQLPSRLIPSHLLPAFGSSLASNVVFNIVLIVSVIFMCMLVWYKLFYHNQKQNCRFKLCQYSSNHHVAK